LREISPRAAKRVNVTDDVAFLAELGGVSRPIGGAGVCVVSPAVDPLLGRTLDSPRILRVVESLRSAGVVDRVTVIAHDIRPTLDGDYCRHLARTLEAELAIKTELADGAIGSRLVDTYAEAAVVLTARLHGLIVGALLRRPVAYFAEAAGKLGPFGKRFGFPCVPADVSNSNALFEDVILPLRQLDEAKVEAELVRARERATANFAGACPL
jgi:hypothetical protein